MLLFIVESRLQIMISIIVGVRYSKAIEFWSQNSTKESNITSKMRMGATPHVSGNVVVCAVVDFYGCSIIGIKTNKVLVSAVYCL